MMVESRVCQSRSCSRFFLLGLHMGMGRREAYLKPAGVLGHQCLDIRRILCFPYKMHIVFRISAVTEGDLRF